MSASDGPGNSNGTSSYFNNGTAEENGAGFFDHNPSAMNQWGYSPADHNSVPGGFPQGQQQQHPQQYQQPQQAPQFYNPAEFPKLPSHSGQQVQQQPQQPQQQQQQQQQQPAFYNPYDGGQFYQPQEPAQHDGIGYPQQQPFAFGQQPSQQGEHGEGKPQQPQQQQQEQMGEHRPEADQGQMPYHQGWQGYSDPAAGMYGYQAPVSQAQGQDGHWQNQQNTAPVNQGEGQDAHWQNQQDFGHGHHLQTGQPLDHFGHPHSEDGVGMSAGAQINNHEVAHPAGNAAGNVEADAEGHSGLGNFFHDDGTEFTAASIGSGAQENQNIPERTSPDMNIPNMNPLQAMEHEEPAVNQGMVQRECTKPDLEGSETNIPPLNQSSSSGNHVDAQYQAHPSENSGFGGGMKDMAPENDSFPQEPSTVDSGKEVHHGAMSSYTAGNPQYPFVVSESNAEESKSLQSFPPQSASMPAQSAPVSLYNPMEQPTLESTSASGELAMNAEASEVVHELLSVPMLVPDSATTPQDAEPTVDSTEVLNTLAPRIDPDLPKSTLEPQGSFGATPAAVQEPPAAQPPAAGAEVAPVTSEPLQPPSHATQATSSQQPVQPVVSETNPPPPARQASVESERSSTAGDSPKRRSDSLSSGTHPSAFRQVRGHHGHRDISVNPSPPLWQTEVPALPGNILLAPALNISSNYTPVAPSGTLTAPSISTPRELAASVASVSVPPMPVVAAPLLAGTHNPGPNPPVSTTNQPAPATSASTVQQITQNVSQLNLHTSVPSSSAPTLLPSGNVQQTHMNPLQPLASGVNQPQPVVSMHNAPVQASLQAQPVTSSGGVNYGLHVNNPVVSNALPQGSGVQPMQQQPPAQTSGTLPDQQQTATGQPLGNVQVSQQQNPGPGAVQQQMVAGQPMQQGPQQQPGQPQGYNQYPAEGGHWYPTAATAGRSPYPAGYYQGGPYRQASYNRLQAGYDYGSPYARHQHYARQHDPYYQSPYGPPQPRTPQGQRSAVGENGQQQQWERDRPASRQGVAERPRSRQGWGYDQHEVDPRYARSRRDPRYYGADARQYDRRYYEYYYRNRQGSQYKEGHEGYYQKNRSASQQYLQEESADGSYTEKKDTSQNQSFSEKFHHQGGNTPEDCGANQSAINSSGYDYREAQWRRGSYGYENSSGMAGGYDVSGYYPDWQRWHEQEEAPAAPATPPPPERMTPVKHAIPHMVARFSPGGQLIKVLPNMPADGMTAVVEIHSVETMIEHCEEYQEFKAYPGPLIKGETHKNDVLHFAAGQASECLKSTELMDRESAALLWDLLVLLCRQNGTVVETDISDLLLKDHVMTSRPQPTPTPTPTPSQPGQEGEAAGDVSTSAADPLALVLQQPKGAGSEGKDLAGQTHRFRELLLFGRKKEALEWAMKNGLWGHALLLASKMDNRTHASVMTRFANSLPMNDPLQTLYQLMSDRQPAAVTSCSDEKWGDWRPHLAMVMSNLSSSAEIGFKSVVTLGDSLASRGLLHASQFCYLMAQIGFGIYSKKTTKIVLLGSSHTLAFNQFATNPAIQLTEIYEYAQMLANKHFLIPNFQAYKFIYACRLADFGFTSQALRYCETIANTIQYSANFYNGTLVSQLCQLSHRLKHHDPEFHDMREITEPHWIVPLENILTQINEGQLKPPSSSGTPMPWVESSSNLSTMGVESTDGTVQAMSEGASAFPYEGQEGGQGMEGYDDQQQGSHQYPDQQYDYSQQQQQQVPFYDYNQQQQPQQHPEQQQQQQEGTQDGQQQQQQYYANYQPYQTQPISSNFGANQDPGASMGSNFSEYSTTTNASETEGDTTEFEQSNASKFDFNAYNQMDQHHHQHPHQQPNRSRSNTYNSMGGPPSPQKTLTPPESPASFSRHRTRTMSGGSTASGASTGQRSTKEQQKQQEAAAAAAAAAAKEAKQQAKPKPKSTGGGWMRWFNKKLGGSNIHLPDDTKKTIEWDPVKKQWMNTEEGEDQADSGPPPPPPSDKEISGGAPPSSSMPPSSMGGGGPAPSGGPPPMGANKFSRKFGPGNYVDVLNKGKGASSLSKPGTTSSLFQTLPAPSTNAPVNFFIPDSSVDDSPASNQEGDPQVGNPGSRPHSPSQQQKGLQGEDLSRSSSMSDLSSEVSQHMSHQTTNHPPATWPQQDMNAPQQHHQQQHQAPASQPPPAQQPPQEAQPPPGMPMFFNPQQFANQGAPTGFGQPPAPAAAAGQPSRRGYGAPRQYPKQR